MKNQSGYILVLTLMGISLAVGLVTAIVRQTFNYRTQVRSSFERTRARMLALSSLELALAQLSLVLAKDAGQKTAAPQAKAPQPQPPTQAPGKKDTMQQWAEKAFPYLNRWQTFNFDDSGGGLEGSMRLYIASENGKINIRSLEKPPEQQQAPPAPAPPRTPPGRRGPQAAPQPAPQTPVPQGDKKDPLAFIDQLFGKDKEASLKNALKDFKTTFKRPVEDPSELLRIKKLDAYKDLLFITPDSSDRSFLLMDLFTVVTPDVKINPFLLSRSAKKLFGFTESKDTTALAKGVKSSMNWATEWDKVLAPVYGKTYGSLDPELKNLLSPSFKATAFSVLVYCKVGSITQRLYALLELAEPSDDFSPQSMIFRVARVYWL
ncbi:hypothetical protein H0W26_01450 [Candidatus Dependentiae bacterium]|nr:hypothetical protein [Candidatus Dependentiae bacterium]